MDGRPPAGTSQPRRGTEPGLQANCARKGPSGPFLWEYLNSGGGRLGSGRLAEHPGDLRAALGALALGSEPPVGKFLLLTLELTLLAALDAVALITRHAGSFLDASLDASLRRPPVAGFGHPEANTTFPPALSPPFASAGGRALVAWRLC